MCCLKDGRYIERSTKYLDQSWQRAGANINRAGVLKAFGSARGFTLPPLSVNRSIPLALDISKSWFATKRLKVTLEIDLKCSVEAQSGVA